jgi:hypothetical protein
MGNSGVVRTPELSAPERPTKAAVKTTFAKGRLAGGPLEALSTPALKAKRRGAPSISLRRAGLMKGPSRALIRARLGRSKRVESQLKLAPPATKKKSKSALRS